MAKVRLLIGYHGARYHGWQQQRELPTIEGEVTDAVEKMSGERIRVWGASRTDAGVHAHGQVACFDERIVRSAETWHAALNRWLPEDIQIYAAQKVPDSFHPRHNARGKMYSYRIWTGPIRDYRSEAFAWQLVRPLSINAMREAAQALIGEHDFSAFRAVNCDAASPVRRIRRIDIRRESPHMVRVTVEGSAFLKYMVRNVVGSLVWVGAGRRPVEWLGEALASRDRGQAGQTAPSHALTLEAIHYPHDPWEGYAGEIFRSI